MRKALLVLVLLSIIGAIGTWCIIREAQLYHEEMQTEKIYSLTQEIVEERNPFNNEILSHDTRFDFTRTPSGFIINSGYTLNNNQDIEKVLYTIEFENLGDDKVHLVDIDFHPVFYNLTKL